MSLYTVEVDRGVVNSIIADILNKELNRSLVETYSGAGAEIKAAVHDLVYSRKDEIITMVVDRAVKEIVKKGLPKLIERCDNG